MPRLPPLLLLAMLLPLASASVTDDARPFLLPNEDFLDVSSAHYSGGGAVVLRGSAGSLVLLDNATGAPLAPDDAVEALSDVRLTISPAEAQELTSRAHVFSDAVANCKQVYADFATGAGSNCLETSYYRYRCGYLWSTGFWRGIISFSIIDAKAGIERGFNEMGNATTDLIAAGEALSRGDTGAAGPAATALEKAKSGYDEFYKQHSLMTGYPPFATNGRLNRCSLGNADIDRMTNIVGAYVDASSQAGKGAVKARIAETLTRGAAGYYTSWSLSRLDDYDARTSQFNGAFSTVRGARAFFALTDEEELRLLVLGDPSSYEDALSRTASFSAAYAKALKRIDTAQAALPEYRTAAYALAALEDPATKAIARADPAQAQKIADRVTTIETDFILLEQNLRINGNATAAEFRNVTARLQAERVELENSPGGSPLAQGLPGVSLTELIGFALLVAVAGALSYQYYRSRQQF